MPFKIVESVPEDCASCEHYSEHTGCHHPKNDTGVVVSYLFAEDVPPPANCPIRLGWPSYYKQVPINFPEDFKPTEL